VKAITLLSLGGPLSLAVLLSACAADQQVSIPDNDASANGAGNDAAGNKNNNGNGDAPQGSQTCSSACTTDVECQSRCPALDSGVYCCDLSNLCYPNASATCPSAPMDGGGLLPD
jgi:hypothetical protein